MHPQLPVLIERHFFTNVSVTSNPQFKRPTEQFVDAAIDSQLQVGPVKGRSGRFQGQLRVRVDASNSVDVPYSVDVTCICDLIVTDGVPKEAHEPMALQFAHAVLYPAIREAVLSITARQCWGQFSIGLAVVQPVIQVQPSEPVELPVKQSRPRAKATQRKSQAKSSARRNSS
jgi:preprotein translocase subunit SecB